MEWVFGRYRCVEHVFAFRFFEQRLKVLNAPSVLAFVLFSHSVAIPIGIGGINFFGQKRVFVGHWARIPPRGICLLTNLIRRGAY